MGELGVLNIILVTFLVAMSKYLSRWNLKKEAFPLDSSSKRYAVSWQGRHDNKSCRLGCHSTTTVRK